MKIERLSFQSRFCLLQKFTYHIIVTCTFGFHFPIIGLGNSFEMSFGVLVSVWPSDNLSHFCNEF